MVEIPIHVIAITKMKLLTNNVPLYVARAINRSPIMARVAMFSVVVSVVVMVIAVCVVKGFSTVVDSKVKGILSSYQVVRYDNNFSSDRGFIVRDGALEAKMREGGYTVSAYATKTGMAKNDGEMSGIELKGIEDEERLAFYDKYLIDGRLPIISGEKRIREVIISNSLAKHLKLKSGDKLEMLFFEDPPLREQFLVTGIYDTALGTLDKSLIITDLRNVQYIYEWGRGHIGGYDVNGQGSYDELCDIVDTNTEDAIMVIDIRRNFPQIYSWLELQKSNELVIITIMLIVGVINIVSMVMILLLQNIYKIGVFTVLGMQQSDIRKVFIYRSLTTILRAVVIGNIVALVLLYLQQRFAIIRLDPTGYWVDSVPVAFAWDKIFIINVLIIGVMFLFQWITTFIIYKSELTNILKYEKR